MGNYIQAYSCHTNDALSAYIKLKWNETKRFLCICVQDYFNVNFFFIYLFKGATLSSVCNTATGVVRPLDQPFGAVTPSQKFSLQTCQTASLIEKEFSLKNSIFFKYILQLKFHESNTYY